MLQARSAYLILTGNPVGELGPDSRIILKRIVRKCIIGTLTDLQQFL